ncbi:MAG: helix-turn-helix transcriptional regulator, partial [Acidimicrobiaceae bacterium]|nr:helix-turn-helix transcriptional regulator [Acidimicrobiaceae bacterium]
MSGIISGMALADATQPGSDGDRVDPELTDALGPSVSTEELCRVVGSRVREFRRSLNMTMSEFAAGAEISLGMLSKIEHGQSAPSLST